MANTPEIAKNIPTNRVYVIFAISEIDTIDFNEVLETSAETLRVSIDGTKTFVKFNGMMPTSVSSLTTKEGPYTHDEILAILATEEWSSSADIGI
jgi:hypothetical protein